MQKLHWILKFMKILITLRHPGPTQAIMAILPELEKDGHEIQLVLTDVALVVAGERYQKILQGKSIYFFRENTWVKKSGMLTGMTQKGKTEFEEEYDIRYLELVEDMKRLIQIEMPDVILRTTPVSGYGVDEAITRAANELGVGGKIRCYQEIYDCGMDLEKVEAPIGVVDKKAAERLSRKGIEAVVIGWMNQTLFLSYISFEKARKKGRKALNIVDEERTFLYCAVASGNEQAELDHFRCFIHAIKKGRVFIKFHPRNSEQYQQKFMELDKEHKVFKIQGMEIECVLAVSDYLISPGSTVNLDCLQYQIISGMKMLKTISIYINDQHSKDIIASVFGCDVQPYMENGMGSIIMNSFKELNNLEDDIEQKKLELYEEAVALFGTDIFEGKQRFIHYIVGD